MPDTLMTGPRLYIRLLNDGDVRALSASDLNETEIWFSESGRVPTSTMAFAHMLEAAGKESPSERLFLAICLRETDECIGMTSIRDLDWINRNAESGTRIYDVKHRSAGYGTEAKHLALRYAFEILGMHAMRSDVYAVNTRSAAALIKQGTNRPGEWKLRFAETGSISIRSSSICFVPRGRQPTPSGAPDSAKLVVIGWEIGFARSRQTGRRETISRFRTFCTNLLFSCFPLKFAEFPRGYWGLVKQRFPNAIYVFPVLLSSLVIEKREAGRWVHDHE